MFCSEAWTQADFYPRSPCGERRGGGLCGYFPLSISIHALLAESDGIISGGITARPVFLSTLSLRRATIPLGAPPAPKIHFYPRSPCGERPFSYTTSISGTVFLSTLSLRRATEAIITTSQGTNISIHALLAESDVKQEKRQKTAGISIHALLAESDEKPRQTRTDTRNFYPRSPCGERPIMDNVIFVPRKFLSTLSLRRATPINDGVAL